VKILLDTNIIVDVALDRDPFFIDSEQVLRLIEQQEIQGYISASTFSDLYYIIRKAKGKTWTLQFLQNMAALCQIATVDSTVIDMALTINFRDFEDAIQYSTQYCSVNGCRDVTCNVSTRVSRLAISLTEQY
jgi:predicted nucleic acid-binding protein